MPAAQTALVTGVSRGIGKEIAHELGRRDYRVAVTTAVPRMVTDSSGRMTDQPEVMPAEKSGSGKFQRPRS